MPGKRPHDADEDENDSKRVRSNQGSPIPVRTDEATEDGRKKEAASARLAALKARMAASKQNGTSVKPPEPVPAATPPPENAVEDSSGGDPGRAAALRKIAEIKARMASQRAGTGGSSVNGASITPTPSQGPPDLQTHMQEARAKAAAIAEHQRNASATPAPQPATAPPKKEKTAGRGGLAIGLHPSMMGDGAAATGRDKSNQGPKYSSTKGNQQPPKPKINPYLSAEPEGGSTSTDAPVSVAARRLRPIHFHEKGKWIAVAKHLREQEELERMKRQIAADARKIEIEEAGDKAFLVPEPPAVEWWDESILPGGQKSYEDWAKPGRNRIETEDSIITSLVQHPVILAAPQDKFIPEAKPLMLTQTEQKKLRRQRRMADMKEEQAKIRLGLVEPPPPKVKKSNMMRVLGEQAVKDPTAVEARVNREIAERAENHERANLDRQLTTEQRHEKLKAQQAGDAAKGVKMAVFKVDNLSSGKHRYQVDVNAKQNALTGIVILNPDMNLIIVEGGEHSLKNFKKLMLNRVKWSENVAPQVDSKATTFTGTTDGSNADASAGTKGAGSKAAAWCSAFDADGQLKDLSDNRCVLIWEGDEPTRIFKRWGSKACETDGEARDVLRRQKMENMWTLARSK